MLNECLTAKTVKLRLANELDADFIYSLRINEKLNKHISSVDGGIEAQKEWLKKYKERERKDEEFYFIIETLASNQKIGTVRIYGITCDDRFCWGSWILNANKTLTSAIESACLVYKYAFECKGLKGSYFQVDKSNDLVISFHKKSGAKIIKEDARDFHFVFEKKDYNILVSKYSKFLKGN